MTIKNPHDIPKLVESMQKLFAEFGSTLILQALANEVCASCSKFNLSEPEIKKIIKEDLKTYEKTLTKILLTKET